VAPLRSVSLIAILLPLVVATDPPERSLGTVETRPATAYVTRLLSPARPAASGRRIDLWVARELSPLLDGELVAEEWRGSLELNVPFATQETTERGFAPRVVFCLAEQRGTGDLLLGCLVQDMTPETALAPPLSPPADDASAAPPDHAARWAAVDRLFVGLWVKGAERPTMGELLLCRNATVAEQGLAAAHGAVGEVAETGWAAELRFEAAPLGLAEAEEVGLLLEVRDAARASATWPAGAKLDDPASWGRLVARRPGTADEIPRR